MQVRICEYCGARVMGNVCEYCDMPVIRKPEYNNFSSSDNSNINKNAPSPSFVYSNPEKKKKKHSSLKIIVIAIVAVKMLRSFIIPAIYFNSVGNLFKDTSSDSSSSYSYTESAYGTSDYDNKTEYSASETFRENGIFPSGTYEIGVDIPEGLYIFIPEIDDHGIEAIYSDPACNNQISAAYCHFDGNRIAEVSGNGYLEISWCTAYDLSMHPEIVNDPFENEGMFIVGRDIDAGTYSLAPFDNEYGDYAEWTIYSSINPIAPVKSSWGRFYDYGSGDENSAKIILNDGEILELTFCTVKEKIN